MPTGSKYTYSGVYVLGIRPNHTASHTITSWQKIENTIKLGNGEVIFDDLVAAVVGHPGGASGFVKESLNNLPPLAQPANWAERSGETR